MRPLLILAALAQAAFAAPSVEQEALPGLPAVKVQDLHYGDVLFRFYQQDYFDSLVRLASYRDQGRLAAHARDAELLRGGLYLSLGQHREARDIFERLLADPATPADVRSRAWFYLGKLLYASGEYEQSDRALRQSAGTLPEELDAERRLLIAQGLLYRKRYDQAIAELSGWQGPRYWLLYGQFNLGVALVRAGEAERGLALLDAVGSLETRWPELMALRDKANLAIGYARLQAGEPAAARSALERVRLSGPQSSKALLGAGWADAAAKQYEAALLPWHELQGRNLLDAAVQESFLAVPYAYAELGAMAQAVEYYERAISAYDAERARIGESIGAIRSGELLAAAMKSPGRRPRGMVCAARDAAGLAGIALPVPLAGGTRIPGGAEELPRARRDGPESLGLVGQSRGVLRHGGDAQAGIRAEDPRRRRPARDRGCRDHQRATRCAAG